MGLAILLSLCLMSLAARAAGPVETSIFAVQGVSADVTGKDATAAKNQALMDVQVKAFFILVERLGSPEIARELSAMQLKEIAPYLKSLSIEHENSAPGRYIGKFTVRFLPGKMRALLGRYGVNVPAVQAPAVVIIPLWNAADGPQLWEDNLWRQAWLDLGAEQALVPLIVALGDLEDTETLAAADALAEDPVKLEAVRRRYNAVGVLVATAAPAEGNGIHAAISGRIPQGELKFSKTYTSEEGTREASAALAVRRFQALMIENYKQQKTKAAAETAAADPGSGPSRSLPVAVPFSSPSQWNGIRSRILATPNVIGVDVSTLDGSGAVIRLMFTESIGALRANMRDTGLDLSQVGGTWMIEPL
ncbi:MAG: DUF2066 domain-containing protein [Hyphomicrobiales bacterium]